MTTSIKDLPTELLDKILKYLRLDERFKLAASCTEMAVKIARSEPYLTDLDIILDLIEHRLVKSVSMATNNIVPKERLDIFKSCMIDEVIPRVVGKVRNFRQPGEYICFKMMYKVMHDELQNATKPGRSQKKDTLARTWCPAAAARISKIAGSIKRFAADEQGAWSGARIK